LWPQRVLWPSSDVLLFVPHEKVQIWTEGRLHLRLIADGIDGYLGRRTKLRDRVLSPDCDRRLLGGGSSLVWGDVIHVVGEVEGPKTSITLA